MMVLTRKLAAERNEASAEKPLDSGGPGVEPSLARDIPDAVPRPAAELVRTVVAEMIEQRSPVASAEDANVSVIARNSIEEELLKSRVAWLFFANADFKHALHAKKRAAASSAVTDDLARQRGKCPRCQREKSLASSYFCGQKAAYAWAPRAPNTLRYQSRRRSRSKRSCPQSGLRKPSTPGREIWIWRQMRVATAKHASRQKRPRAKGAARWRGKRESSSGRKLVDVRTAGSMTKSRVACALSTRKNIGRCAWL